MHVQEPSKKKKEKKNVLDVHPLAARFTSRNSMLLITRKGNLITIIYCENSTQLTYTVKNVNTVLIFVLKVWLAIANFFRTLQATVAVINTRACSE